MPEKEKRVKVFARVDPRTHAVLQAYKLPNIGRAIDAAIEDLKKLRSRPPKAPKVAVS